MNEHVMLVCRLAAAIAQVEDDPMLNPMTEETLLERDLGFGSIDFVRLVVDVERELGQKLGFHDLLMPGGRYVSDLSIGSFCAFIDARLANRAPAGVVVAPSSISSSAREGALPEADSGDDGVTADRLRELRQRMSPPAPAWSIPSKRLKRTLFILTPPRSGSTLLQLMLSAHPEVFAPPELYMLGYTGMRQRKSVLDTQASRILLTGAVQAIMEAGRLSHEQAEDVIRQMEQDDPSTLDFYAVIQDWIGERLLVDKSPLYTSHVDIMRRAECAFEKPLYIHLVRHPAGMIKSFLDTRIGEMIPFANGMICPPAVFAEMIWQISHENISRFLSDVPEERFCRLQFEELVRQPEACLRRVCEFLGMPYIANMANPYTGADGFSAARDIGRFSGDLKVHLYQGVQAEAADRWRQHISESSLSDSTLGLYQKLVGVSLPDTTL